MHNTPNGGANTPDINGATRDISTHKTSDEAMKDRKDAPMMAVMDDTMDMKYIVVTGGSLSGLGKGVTVCSLGTILRSLGLRVTAIKIDPYLNVDAGTMSPYEHGEVFVLDDGGEVDLDLGNYERAFDINMSKAHNITSGKLFKEIIEAERRGDYLGKTVQMLPHVGDLVQKWLKEVSCIPINNDNEKPHICLVEVGGTVGDIESAIYLEALQEFKAKVGDNNFVSCHLSYVPTIGSMGEQKTKPTQHSTKELSQCGLRPDFIFSRCKDPLNQATRSKICTFCPIEAKHLISCNDVQDMNEIPLSMAKQSVHHSICQRLGIPLKPQTPEIKAQIFPFSLTSIQNLVNRRKICTKEVNVGIVGKYTGSSDSYLSVIKALEHACLEVMVKLKVSWIESSELEADKEDPCYQAAMKKMSLCDAIICPGGFGDRGISGKSSSSHFCRMNKIPYLGICLGLHTSLIEIATNVLNLKDANSEEFNSDCNHPVIISMPEHNDQIKGGTMRLGSRATHFHDTNSLSFKLYNQEKVIHERHRHRYEVNPIYIEKFESCGVNFVGKDDHGTRMEILELKDHPYYICTQFHPEFKTRPTSPAPLFLGLILATQNKLASRLESNGGKLLPGQSFYNEII